MSTSFEASAPEASPAAERPPRRALCLINKNARAGDADLAEAQAVLAGGGLEVLLDHPQAPDEASDLIERQGAGADLIIVGGGDGTLSGLTGALMKAGKPIGILPLGTANDLARSLGLPAELDRAAALIVEGRTRPIDVGMVNDRPFLNVASIGLSAEVARAHRGELKKWLGVLNYVLSLFEAYRATRPFRVWLKVDGIERRLRCAQIAVGAGRHYGGGMTIAEQAEVGDGRLYLYWIEPVGLLGWIRLLPALRRGSFQREDHAFGLSADQLEIRTSVPRTINVDGELVERTPATFTITHQALTVFAPPQEDRPPPGMFG